MQNQCNVIICNSTTTTKNEKFFDHKFNFKFRCRWFFVTFFPYDICTCTANKNNFTLDACKGQLGALVTE